MRGASASRVVSLADTRDHARAIAMDLEQFGPGVWERFREVLSGRHPALLRELELKVLRLEAFRAVGAGPSW